MYDYAAGSAMASSFSPFTSPPRTTNPGGLTGQAGAVIQASATQAGGNAHTTSAQLTSSVPQALQGLSTPGASLGSSGASAPLGALSSLSSTSGKSATKTAGAGTSALNGLAATAAPALSANTGEVGLEALGLSSDVAGFGSDGAGLGADGGGIGIDLQGLQMDYQGLQLDYEGAGSILGAEGVPGFQGPTGAGGLGGVGPAIGQGAGASASVGQAASLGTVSVPPSWADTVSSVTPLPGPMSSDVAPGGWGAAPSPHGGVSRLPLGGMVGRGSEGAVQRVGFRAALMPRWPGGG
jgi:PPE-repeat protein